MRQFSMDLEPVALTPFNDQWEKNLNSVQQVKGMLKNFII